MRRFAAEQIKYATAFLQWLGERNSTPASCGQIDIDAWYGENNEHSRTCLRAFLNRCHAEPPLPTHPLRPMKVSLRAALSGDERLDAVGRLLTDAEMPMRLRVAGVIVLLYAQPVSRIVRLSVDDVIRDGDTVLLRLGEPASSIRDPTSTEAVRQRCRHFRGAVASSVEGVSWSSSGLRLMP
ncbi:hypothetical protein OHT20_00400 [Streptomyces caniferus]|uniref:hypothetical protein n=1 Tax=Streptomyces caniferus TaxID=285557 RepID=UPI002E2926E4|nr:hypothetical protein [Streptomyces caniferus]